MLVEICRQSGDGLLRQSFNVSCAAELELGLRGCAAQPQADGEGAVLLLQANSPSAGLRLLGQLATELQGGRPALLYCAGLSRQAELAALRLGAADCLDSSARADELFHALERIEARSAGAQGQAKLQLMPRSEDLLPLCSCCKSTRDSQGNWQRIEQLIMRVLGRQVTHSICPACVQALYPGMTISEPQQRERAAS